VTERSGDVAITANGNAHDGGAGSTLALPSRIVTGADGLVALSQDETRISVAARSDIEIPADAAQGHLVARLVQRSGNVFYDVQKREAGRLRVETPFLVAVIKGTQFNIAVQGDSTTISLFEGRLEIRMPDDTEVIQLNAGEIAIRSAIDDSIRVIGMNDQALAIPTVNDAGRVAVARDAVAAVAAAAFSAGSTEVESTAALDVRAGNVTSARTLTTSSVDVNTTSDLRATALQADSIGSVDGGGSGPSLDTSLDAGVDLGGSGPSLDVGFDAGADLGGSNLDASLDTSVDLGAGSVDASVGLGDTALDVGLSPDTGLDVDLDLDLVDDVGSLLGGGSGTDDTDDTGGSSDGGVLGDLLGPLL
jgi:hypothetical protein